MYGKLSLLAAALLGGLLFNTLVASAASSFLAQGGSQTHRVFLPITASSSEPAVSAPPPTAPPPTPSPTPAPVASPTPAPSGASVYTGVSLAGAPWDMNAVTSWEQNVAGKTASIINFWSFWSNAGVFQGFDRAAMDNARNHGSIPMVTWTPEQSGNGSPDQPDFRLSNIIGGQYDAQIKMWAGNARLWGHPFFLRFAHEPDGNWFPWGEDANGNQRGQYVLAWRHVHDLFTAAGATNVTWVWCVNEEWDGSPRPSYASLYPGDGYVDWTCVDGYNWGTKYGTWRPFDQIFRYSYDTLVQVAPTKPMMLGEWASAALGGSLGDWITDAFTVQIPANYPQIRAEVWYNWLTAFDWRIESTPGAPQALRAAMSSSRYRAAEFAGLNDAPIRAP